MSQVGHHPSFLESSPLVRGSLKHRVGAGILEMGQAERQWVAAGGKYPLEFVLCENSSDTNVPVAGQLKPYA